jgi:Rho termination factor, N-terminal domain
MNPAGLSDSLTIGVLLILVFGAVSFYLYSRMSQTERRVGLLENLLMDLKMSTEAALSGPEMLGPESVEPVSGPAPLGMDDVDAVEEEEYAAAAAAVDAEVAAPAVNANVVAPAAAASSKMDANYESMTVKELAALAKERGLTGVGQRKREIIDALKRSGAGAPPAAAQPLKPVEDELEGTPPNVEGAEL